MYKFRRHTKRATAALLSMMIVISAVSSLFTGLSASAIQPSDVTVLTTANGLTQANSMVDGAPTVYFQKTPAEGPQLTKMYYTERLSDSNFNAPDAEIYRGSAAFCELKSGYNTSATTADAIEKFYIDGTERFSQITLTLKKLTDVSNIVVASHQNPVLRNYYYEIFASDSAVDLYDAANSVYLFTNANNDQLQNFKIAEGKLTGVKYVGMRLYNPIQTEGGRWVDDALAITVNALYPRFYEFNVYGTPSADQSGNILSEAGEMGVPTDASVVASSEILFNDGTGDVEIPVSTSPLLDGNLSSEFMGSGSWVEGSDNNFTYRSDRQYKIIYTLDGLCDVSKILVYHHQTQNRMTYKYKLYAAEKKDDLFKAESLIKDYENSAFMRGQLYTPDLKAKYVALVITQPSVILDTTVISIYPRLMEFNVYGLRDGETDPNAIDLLDGNNIAIPEGTSVVKSVTVKQFDGTSETDNSTSTTPLLDGDTASEYNAATVFAGGTDNNITYPSGRYVKIQYELQGLCEVKNIYVANHSTPKWMTQEYKLYAANSETELYNSDNLIYEYSNSGHKQFQLYTLSRKAKYVAMVITKPSDATDVPLSSIYVRLCEFDVFGTAEESFENPDGVLTEYDSKELPAEKGVVKSTFVNFVKGSTTTSRTEPATALTDNTIDGEFYGGFVWATGSAGNLTYFDNGELRIEHELYGNSDVTDIVVYNHVNPDRMTYKYKIYMSDKRDSLYKTESLVYNFVNTNLKRVQVFSVNRKARFVAMVITQPSSGVDFSAESVYPRLHEFNVYGTPDESIPEGVTDYSDETIPEGNNFLLNMNPGMKITNTEKGISKNISSTTISELNDGTTGGGGFYTGFTGRDYYADWDEENNAPILRADTVYVDFEYKLGGTADVEKFYIGNHASKDRRIAKYAIYMSKEDKGDLFAESNLVGTYENSSGVRGQEIGFGEIKTGIRRIGVRILDAFYDKTANLGWITKDGVEKGSTSVYLRLNEIAAFGTYEADPYQFQKVLRNGAANLPKDVSLEGLKNLSLVFSPKLLFTKNGVEGKTSLTNLEHLTDGDFATESESYSSRFATFENGSAQYYLNGTHYFDAFYDFKSEVKPKYVVVGNAPNVELANAKYNVYISNDKDNLYSDDNLYAEVDNVKALENGEGVTVNVICFDETYVTENTRGRYLGIRIFSPSCVPGVGSAEVTEKVNNLYIRLREFAVYGEYTDPTFEYIPRNLTDTDGFEGLDKLDEIYGKNILNVKNISYMNGGKKVQIGTNTDEQNDFWADNTGATHYDFSNFTATSAGSPVWIFKLPEHELTNIKGFAYQGVTNSGHSDYFISHLKVYVATEREDLLLPQSCVFEYNAEEDGTKKGIVYEFPKDRIPQGTYIAFEFVNPVTSASQWTYMRMSLLHAWGSEAKIEVKPANIAENMPIDAYFNTDGNLEKITDSNLSVKEVKTLTDGNAKTSAKINTKGKDTEILYNLCGDINIDKLVVKALNDSDSGFKAMKVYAADTLAEVNEDEALIWVYKPGSKSKFTATKKFSSPKKMRYVRFVFEDTKKQLEIFEIEAIGLDNQKMKTRNITSALTSQHINLSRTRKGGKPAYVSAADSILGQLIDGDLTSFIQITKGTVGEDKYDILIYLDDLRTISSITTSFIKGFREYRPKTINVYVGETEKDATAEDAKPLYTINTNKVKGDQHTKEIRPMLGRYVRFELSEFYFNEYLVDKDGKGVIAAIIGDIKIVGTKVQGLQTDENNDVLLEFTDSDSGISAIIKRMDINDIFTDVMKIRVTPEKATNWQMRSLQERGSLMIRDKRIYKIELLDLYGNKVTDIGGRKLEIRFPRPKDVTNGSALIGNASKRTTIEACNTVESNEYITAEVSMTPDSDLKVAFLEVIASDDPYWDTIGELENFEEGSEDDLKGDGNIEIHDASWYDSIHTDDELFTVTPINFTLENGVKFEAKDISATASEDNYKAVLQQSFGKKVAIYYDMGLTLNGEKYDLGGQWVEVSVDLPNEVTANFTDLGIFHIDEYGVATQLWSTYENDRFIFQTNGFSDFAIVGTATDSGASDENLLPDGNGAEVVPEDGPVGDELQSPATGENTDSVFVALMFLVAAAYVAVRFGTARKSAK